MPWLRGPDDAPEQHACPLPDVSRQPAMDYKRIRRWRWICPICDKVYRPREEDEFSPVGPNYEWVHLMPWTEWYWRRKAPDLPPGTF